MYVIFTTKLTRNRRCCPSIFMITQFPLKELHHLTAIRDDAERNDHLFTDIIEMRLVKKNNPGNPS